MKDILETIWAICMFFGTEQDENIYKIMCAYTYPDRGRSQWIYTNVLKVVISFLEYNDGFLFFCLSALSDFLPCVRTASATVLGYFTMASPPCDYMGHTVLSWFLILFDPSVKPFSVSKL